MAIQISDHFSYSKLLRFAFPSIVMMVFTSLYTIVDGLFVSNLAGPEEFTALNLIWPAIGLIGSFGFMIGTGGTALISKTLGEKNKPLASEYFSMLISFEVILGIILAAMALIFAVPLARLCGATEELIPGCLSYGIPLFAAFPFYFLSTTFQTFLVAAGKPKLGLGISLLGGGLNILLDYVFVGGFSMGAGGAALATALNWVLTSLIPIWWFFRHKEAEFHFVRFKWRFKAIAQSCFNGMSEMVTNISMNLVVLLYNLALMKMAGSDGVVVYGILQYLTFLFSSIFLGYTLAVAPCIGYQYGAANHAELKNLLVKSLVLIGISNAAMVILADWSAPLLSSVFVSYSDTLMQMTQYAIGIYSLGFLFAGFNGFASGFFTALNNGVVSALLAFMRTFVFQVGSILILPGLFGLTGIWSANVVSEVLSFVMSIGALVLMRKKYGY